MNDTLNMCAITNFVRNAGFHAYVEQTGGGVATIYAYRQALPDGERWYAVDDGQPDVLAGPGTFDWSKNGASQGYRGDFSVGRTAVDAATMEWGDDDYRTDLFQLDSASDKTEQDLADVIVSQLRAAVADFGPRMAIAKGD